VRARTPNGRPDRRPRRHDAAIIDAEIIESTVLGRTALDATIVSATVIDSVIDGSVIDVEVIETTVVDSSAYATSERRSVAGRAAARDEARTSRPSQPPGPFAPANDVEENLLEAVTSGQTDKFLSTLLLAKVLIPIPPGEPPDVRPDSPTFPWRREVVDGQ